MGSCYLVASMCLKAAEEDPGKEKEVSYLAYRSLPI